MITGLYKYIRNGKLHYNKFLYVKNEIKKSLEINPERREKMIFYAGDRDCAEFLRSYSVKVENVFSNAPVFVRENSAHLMKQFMILYALKKYGEVLWIDWDVIILKWPDSAFWEWCRKFNTPKFLYIKNYWAVVNCAVYFVNRNFISPMEKSFSLKLDPPNDELYWKKILPDNITMLREYWLHDFAINIWDHSDIRTITRNTYFVHTKSLDYYPLILKKVEEITGNRFIGGITDVHNISTN